MRLPQTWCRLSSHEIVPGAHQYLEAARRYMSKQDIVLVCEESLSLVSGCIDVQHA